METDCERAREFVLLWEEDGGKAVLAPELGAFEAHVSMCPECGRKYRPLLPLVERDLLARKSMPTDEEFVARVMEVLPPLVDSGASRVRRILVPVAAAAALVLVLGGLAFFRFGQPPRGRDMVAIHFTLDAPAASSVVLVGSFSDWSVDDRFRLKRAEPGTWELSVDLKRDELYSYGFLVDGEKWLVDPKAAETIDDGFGGENSLLRL